MSWSAQDLQARAQLPISWRRTLPGALLQVALAYAPTFEGRATRIELVVTVFVAALAGGIGAWLTASIHDDLVPASNLFLGVLTALPIVSAIIRRLHDSGRHGWVVFAVLVPWGGWIFLLIVLLSPGLKYETEFGPPPNSH